MEEESTDIKETTPKVTNTFQTTSFEPYKKEGSSGKWLTIGLALIVLALIGGALYYLRGESPTIFKAATPAPTATPASTPEPTPNPLIRSEWSFEILNGTSTKGEAKRIADQLIELGYQVVKTGNADKSTYTNNELYVQKGLEDKINLVVLDLKDVIKVASISGELKDSTASARIII